MNIPIFSCRKTYELTSQDRINEKLNNTNMRFTLFAPNDLAWEKIYRASPTEFKKLQMGGFGYHIGRILERHMIVGRAFTIEELQQLSSNASLYSFPIQAVHGILRVENRDQLLNRYNQYPSSFGEFTIFLYLVRDASSRY